MNLQMLKINMNRALPIMLIALATYLLTRNSFKFYVKLFLISHVNNDSSLRNKEHSNACTFKIYVLTVVESYFQAEIVTLTQ